MYLISNVNSWDFPWLALYWIFLDGKIIASEALERVIICDFVRSKRGRDATTTRYSEWVLLGWRL
jgi:hypothetical protein